jgi:hypothetical protein
MAAPGTPARPLQPTASTLGGKAARPAGPAAAAPARPSAAGLARQALQRSELTASMRAQATHQPVVVSSMTDTGTLVTANPDGSFTLTETSEPVRVLQHGTWVPINPDLVHGANGTWHTTATTSGVTFSGGGTGAMAAMTSGADSLAFTFPGALPKPNVSGPVATYRNVLPGVDLQLTANASGFSELLIVHSKAAAANPALRTLQLGMTAQGVTVASTPDGGAQATTKAGATVFHTDTASMWDSAPATATGAGTTHAARPMAAGTAASEGMGHRATVGVRVSRTAETLVPSASLLTSPTTVYPVYIDPAWSGSPSQLHWARISSNGWNIYDSTSTAGSDHPRSGYDDWAGGGDEVARTFYQMNTTGIAGAHVSLAYLYVVNNWSADSSATNMDLYDTAEPSGWSSSGLTWSNQPGAGTLQDSGETSYETSSGTVSPGTIRFTVTNGAQASAGNGGGKLTLELRSGSESNDLYWKQYASGGGATISVDYYVTPDLVGGTGSPTLTPSPIKGADAGFITSPTPTMKISCEANSAVANNVESVENFYQVYNYSGGTETTQVGSDLTDSKITKNGDPVTSGTLADGTYAWRARCKNGGPNNSDTSDSLGSYQYWSPWSAWQVFTVDTSNPPTPAVTSPQFPAGMEGGAATDNGAFTFTNDRSDNVLGYLFSMDNDLSSTVFAGGSFTTVASGSTITIKPGTIYWTPASTDPNGYSVVTFAPGSTGPHRIYSKAVDQAGNTSGGEATYLFWAGFTTPTFVGGTQMVSGGTINGTTGVPAGTYAAGGGGTGSLTTQSDCCGMNWWGGAQAWLANGSGAVASGDSITLSFPVSSSTTGGVWDIGMDFTKSFNYGTFSIKLNANATTGTPAVTLLGSFDGYSSTVSTQYEDLGVPQYNGGPLALPAGIYSITLTITGENASSTGYQAGFDVLRLAPMAATCTITSISGCYNNTAISPSSDLTSANADGYGNSLDADLLSNAGWAPGAALTVNGAPMTLPAYGDDKADNMVASGQTVTIPSTGYANTGNAIEFLAFSTDGGISNASGVITYASPCVGKNPTQGYSLTSVPDWASGSATAAATSFSGRNTKGGADNTTAPARVYAISVPLACATDPVVSITLPAITNGVQPGFTALHILALGIRPSSYTDTTYSQNWTATFAAKEDSHDGSLPQTTVRMPAVISVAGTSLRIHLSNALGAAPITFNHVTVAAQSSGAQPIASTMANVTFGGSASVTIPAGGDVTSDAVPNFTTTQQETLLVSVYTSATIPDTVGHAGAKATSWTTSSTADEAADTTGTPFTATTDDFLHWLTGIDVTSAGNTNGAVGFYGDQSVNSDSSSDAPNRFIDDVTSDLATANAGTVPYGVLSLGENSWTATNNLIPVLSTSATQTSAADPVDRDILAQANIRTVLISTGTADIINDVGTNSDSAATAESDVKNKLTALVRQLKGYYADTMGNNSAQQITVYVATIPASSTFNATEETVRENVNAFICGTGGTGGTCDTSGSTGADLNGLANGFVDFAAAASDGTDLTTTIPAGNLYNGSPNNTYYANEAAAYVTATTSGTLAIQPDHVRA